MLPSFNRDPHFQRVMGQRGDIYQMLFDAVEASIGTLIFRG